MLKPERLLGQILLEKGLITPEHLEKALSEQQRTKQFLGRILVKRYYIKDVDLVRSLAEQFRLPVIQRKDIVTDWDLLKRFTPDLINDHRCFPVKLVDDEVTFAITNPSDVWALDRAKEAVSPLPIKYVLISEEDMEWLLNVYQQYRQQNITRLFE